MTLQNLINIILREYHGDETIVKCDYAGCPCSGRKPVCYMEWFRECELYEENQNEKETS